MFSKKHNDLEWRDLNSQGFRMHVDRRRKKPVKQYICSQCGNSQQFYGFCVFCHGKPHEMLEINEERVY